MKSGAIQLESKNVSLSVLKTTGTWTLLDKRTGVMWSSNRQRFGEITLKTEETQTLPLIPDYVKRQGSAISMAFHPGAGISLIATMTLLDDGESIEIAYSGHSESSVKIENVKLLDDALSITDEDSGYLLVPVRLGLLIPSDSGVEFSHRFDTYGQEGCSAEMLGAVKCGSALLLTWHEPYITAEVESRLGGEGQELTASLYLRKTANSFRLRLLGKGDINTIAEAYRDVARQKGYLVTWEEKLKTHPQAQKLFGAINFKLWTTLARQIDEDLNEVSVKVHWTFDEAKQIAEHLKNDLKLDRVLFILGGWIHNGYDCRHPDILPAAPECGGNEGLADCSRRVRELGYVFSLHDNYQDMYRDAPSWDEDYLMKIPDGSLKKGGLWLGGRAYLTCSKKAVELAKRPQNLPAVKDLFSPDIYFIDTTYAAGLYECFDRNHPLTKWDDMHWKSEISDYARDMFGLFGSECGCEWAIPHSDWFEGLTGVGGRHYGSLDPAKFGGIVAPLFEMVYHDGIVMHGQYGYNFAEAAEYVLHHVSIARTLHYHSIADHLYWQGAPTEELPFPDAGLDKACFTRSHNGWAKGFCLTDRFVKNTCEILSPLNEITSQTRLTRIEFLSPDRKVLCTQFGGDVMVTVNGSESNFTVSSRVGGKVVLPPFGFLVVSPTFIAFHALTWGSIEYDAPVLFTLRSLDGEPLARSERVRVFHGFGDARFSLNGEIHEIPKESVLKQSGHSEHLALCRPIPFSASIATW